MLLRKPVIILENFTEFRKEEQVHSIEQKACNNVNFLQVAVMLPKKADGSFVSCRETIKKNRRQIYHRQTLHKMLQQILTYPTPTTAASGCFAERRDPSVAVQNTFREK